MDISQLHFSHPLWFWAFLALPLAWGLFAFCYRGRQPFHQLEKFIDKHLIPYLLHGGENKKKKLWTHLLVWSLVWSFLVIALAGPRWDFREVDTYTRDQNLAILLDLSESMNAKDIAPSRLGRAKQKIEDLLRLSTGVKIGLIAFAADPHMIVPMTEDKETVRYLLPSLDTDLVYVQGSRLAPALEMANAMLENEPGSNKAVVVISDGGFEDASAIYTAKNLSEKGIVLYAMGVGSQEGSLLKDRQGAVVKKNGSPMISRLEKEKLREISKIGRGRYFDADHSEQVALIFEDLEKRSDVQRESHKTHRFWEEHFYLFLLPVLPFFLWWYRRGGIFALFLFCLMPDCSEASLSSYFYNAEQRAEQAYANEDYAAAGHDFQDPYRKGVAYYRMGDYSAAEEMFRQSTRPEVASCSAYNLGNALVHQNRLRDAITAYEEVLEKWPDHNQAMENLELVKKMLEQQEPPQHEEKQDPQDGQEESKSQRDQKQGDNASQKDDPQQQSDKQPQNDPASAEKEAEQEQKNQKQEEPVREEPSQEKEPPQANEDSSLPQEQTLAARPEKEKPAPRSQEDLDADLWLNQMKNDPKSFLRNKFYLESKKNGTKEEINPW